MKLRKIENAEFLLAVLISNPASCRPLRIPIPR